MKASVQPTPGQLKALQTALKSLRWDDQRGYPSYEGNGKWSFVTTSLQVTPKVLNMLFELAGIEPEEIVPRGQCKDCVFAVDGQERGYSQPCGACTRPYHSNFVGITRVRRSAVRHAEPNKLDKLAEAFKQGLGSTKAVP